MLNKEGFDGIWESYCDKNTKYETQLYLNGIKDTGWIWKNGVPYLWENSAGGYEYIDKIPYDSIQLKKYMQERVATFLNKSQND